MLCQTSYLNLPKPLLTPTHFFNPLKWNNSKKIREINWLTLWAAILTENLSQFFDVYGFGSWFFSSTLAPHQRPGFSSGSSKRAPTLDSGWIRWPGSGSDDVLMGFFFLFHSTTTISVGFIQLKRDKNCWIFFSAVAKGVFTIFVKQII